MNRVIKFRAWDGEKIVFPEYIDFEGTAYWKENSVVEFSDNVMQFTGLQINGRDIFEGDIEESGVIIWHEIYLGWFVDLFDKSMEDVKPLYDLPIIQIIGNIHEHKHLLK